MNYDERDYEDAPGRNWLYVSALILFALAMAGLVAWLTPR
jgi:hypothetical protein